jgi:hypothetical protein
MTSLRSRLRRLEVTAVRPLQRRREFEEFSRTAAEYIRSVRRYLGEPPDSDMTISCRNEGDVTPLVNQLLTYRIRALDRHRNQLREGARFEWSSGKSD